MKHRQSNFELLRIFAMFLIVLYHSVVHGVLSNMQSVQALKLAKYHPVSSLFLQTFTICGRTGVYIFVLITGYFMINRSTSVRIAKLIKLWLPIFFWSIAGLIIATVIFGSQLELKQKISAFLPILTGKYWFMTTYFFMYLTIPVLNVVANQINSKRTILVYFLVSLMLLISCKFQMGKDIFSPLMGFYVIYILGALLRKWDVFNPAKHRSTRKTGIVLTLIPLLIRFLYVGISINLYRSTNNLIYMKKTTDLLLDWTLLPEIMAVGIFLLFGTISLTYSGIINRVARTTFGIYLISDNPYIVEYIWHSLLHLNTVVVSSPSLIVYYDLLTVIIVYIICSILEFIRSYLFAKMEDKISISIDNFIRLKLDQLLK